MMLFMMLIVIVVLLLEDNVDIDIIVLVCFLLIIEKKGLGCYVFYEWCYDVYDVFRLDFVFN